MNHSNAADHPTEERLILSLCGDSDASLDAHLSACDACRAQHQELKDTLALVDAAPVPYRGAEYGAEVWRRISPLLRDRSESAATAGWAFLFQPRAWAMAGSMAALLLLGFFAGRHWPVPSEPIPGQVRERILLVAVGEHLERAQMMLVELVNGAGAQQAGSTVDISGVQRRAEDLVAANRIYRRASAGAGDGVTATVLEELERLLLDISHEPSQLSTEQLERVRRDIESKGTLFKVMIIGSQVREREKAASPAGKGPARGST